jgi:hypothetical protein
VLNPPAVDHVIEVRYCNDDEATEAVVDDFAILLGTRIILSPMSPPERLFRRAIGRNEAALSSQSDLVWFTDCDYLFGKFCLDGLWQAWNDLTVFASILFPEQIMTMRSHAEGDWLVEQNLQGLPAVSPDLFKPQRVHRAFGGIQIVPGSLARKHGYLDGHRRYQQPAATPFPNFHDDVAYRKTSLQYGPTVSIDIPDIFRLRHSRSTYYNGPISS